MAKLVADQFAETLAAAGVKRIYGIVGDTLNPLTDALRRQGKIEWVHVRHEEVAAFAAGAEAHLTGELAVCAGSCGPGNLHLINGLFDCHRSRPSATCQRPAFDAGTSERDNRRRVDRRHCHYSDELRPYRSEACHRSPLPEADSVEVLKGERSDADARQRRLVRRAGCWGESRACPRDPHVAFKRKRCLQAACFSGGALA